MKIALKYYNISLNKVWKLLELKFCFIFNSDQVNYSCAYFIL